MVTVQLEETNYSQSLIGCGWMEYGEEKDTSQLINYPGKLLSESHLVYKSLFQGPQFFKRRSWLKEIIALDKISEWKPELFWLPVTSRTSDSLL